MAGNTSSLTFALFGKDVSATKSLQKLAREGNKTEKAMGRIGVGAVAAGSMIGSLGASAVLALGDMAASAVSTGVQTAAAMEQAQVGFTTLIGSAKGAQDYLQKLSDFAAATPFEMNGLIDASRTLLGVGVAANDVIPMLTDFGDAAGAVGIGQEQFQRIMVATSQAIGAGKFQTADFNQIMNNGLPIWAILSKAMGKPVTVLRDMASKGKLLSKDVLPALQKQMHKDYGGAMAKQSQTLSGIWSTLQDTFTQGMAKVLVPMLPTLKNLATQGIAFLGKAFQWLAAEGPKLASAIGAVGDFLANTWWPILQNVWGWISGTAIPALRDWADQFMTNVWPSIKNVAQMIAQNLKPAIESLVRFWNQALLPALKIALPILGKVAAVIGVVGGAVLVVASWLLGKLAPAVEWIGKKFYAVSLSIISYVSPIIDAWRRAFNAISDAWNRTLGGMSVHVPGIPGTDIGNYDITIPKMPHLAKGGIVTSPTVALIGERGPEAVVPLSRGGGMGTVINITVQGDTDPNAAARRIIRIVNEARASGALRMA